MTRALAAAALCLAATLSQAESAWQPLLQDPSKWEVVGGEAQWQLNQGILRGSDPEISWLGGENSFYTSKQRYRDFVLEYEYKVAPRHNSGVMIRSRMHPQKDNLTGYQVEIDHDPERARFWAGGIYEEKGRGWIHPEKDTEEAAPFTRQGARIIDIEGWNQVKVEAQGTSIKVWLNGELRSDLDDGQFSEGVIGFQVHSVGSNFFKPQEVTFRNVRIREL